MSVSLRVRMYVCVRACVLAHACGHRHLLLARIKVEACKRVCGGPRSRRRERIRTGTHTRLARHETSNTHLGKDVLVVLEGGAGEQVADLGNLKHLVANRDTNARLGLCGCVRVGVSGCGCVRALMLAHAG